VNSSQTDEGKANHGEELEKAKSYLGRLLKYRPRTEEEVRERLTQKDYSFDVIDETLNWAKQNGLVDDRLFAEYYVEDRIQNKPMGRSGMYKELLDHGVDRGLANEVLDEKISSPDEEERCKKLARKRLSRYKNDDVNAKFRKTLGFLERRGFPKGLASSVLKEMLFNDD